MLRILIESLISPFGRDDFETNEQIVLWIFETAIAFGFVLALIKLVRSNMPWGIAAIIGAIILLFFLGIVATAMQGFLYDSGWSSRGFGEILVLIYFSIVLRFLLVFGVLKLVKALIRAAQDSVPF